MKTLTITAEQYNDFVYPACAVNRPGNLQDLRMTVRVLDKLEKYGTPPQRRHDDVPVMGFKLKGAEVTIDFEDAEAEFIAKRLEATVSELQAWRGREMLPIIDVLTKGA